MKKKAVIIVMLTLLLFISACHKEKSAIDLINGQYFDWDTWNETVFVIDENLYHIVNIHDISKEDLQTSKVISEKVFLKDLGDKYYVEQGQMINELTYYLIWCEKLNLYLLVPYKERRKLFDFCPARPLGYCLEP